VSSPNESDDNDNDENPDTHEHVVVRILLLSGVEENPLELNSSTKSEIGRRRTAVLSTLLIVNVFGGLLLLLPPLTPLPRELKNVSASPALLRSDPTNPIFSSSSSELFDEIDVRR